MYIYPKLSDSDDIESRRLWIPAFAGMTNKTQRVPVMPDWIRHPVNGDAGLLGQIAQFGFIKECDESNTQERYQKAVKIEWLWDQ